MERRKRAPDADSPPPGGHNEASLTTVRVIGATLNRRESSGAVYSLDFFGGDSGS